MYQFLSYCKSSRLYNNRLMYQNYRKKQNSYTSCQTFSEAEFIQIQQMDAILQNLSISFLQRNTAKGFQAEKSILTGQSEKQVPLKNHIFAEFYRQKVENSKIASDDEPTIEICQENEKTTKKIGNATFFKDLQMNEISDQTTNIDSDTSTKLIFDTTTKLLRNKKEKTDRCTARNFDGQSDQHENSRRYHTQNFYSEDETTKLNNTFASDQEFIMYQHLPTLKCETDILIKIQKIERALENKKLTKYEIHELETILQEFEALTTQE